MQAYFPQVVLPFPLRRYQQEAVFALLKQRHGTVVLPTATGKTAIALDCIRRLKMRTAVLVPTEVLLKQWVDKLREAGIHAGVYYGKEKRPYSAVTVFIVNSAMIHPDLLKRFSFIVVDETHHLGAEQFCRLLPIIQTKPYALGLTSYIRRSDGRDSLVRKVMPVIYHMHIADAQNQRYIAPMNVLTVQAQMSFEERRIYEEYTETIRRAYRILGTVNPADLAKSKEPLAKACLAAMAKRKVVLSNIQDKKSKVLMIAQKHPNERILVFSESILGANAIQKHLIRNNVPSGIYHSQIPIYQRRRALDLWKKHLYHVLVAVKCLDEGVDVPACRIGIIVASGSANRQWIQRQGRMMRKRPKMTGGVIYIVYCTNTIESRYSQKVAWILAHL